MLRILEYKNVLLFPDDRIFINIKDLPLSFYRKVIYANVELLPFNRIIISRMI